VRFDIMTQVEITRKVQLNLHFLILSIVVDSNISRWNFRWTNLNVLLFNVKELPCHSLRPNQPSVSSNIQMINSYKVKLLKERIRLQLKPGMKNVSLEDRILVLILLGGVVINILNNGVHREVKLVE
jgi:hypothetical protein